MSSSNTIKINDVYIESSGTCVGPMEFDGPLGNYFDYHYDDLYCGQKTFEKAERELVKKAIEYALKKVNLQINDIDISLGGDLLNQIISSNYIAKDLSTPFIGIYGACSNATLSLGLASLLVSSKFYNKVLAFTSSHNATAERQYRYPVEYGVQKAITSEYTVTGSGAAIVSNNVSRIKVESVTFGKVIDLEQNDPNDMGTAMAPAAYDTLKQHLKDTGREHSYYDLILTGDLSLIGKGILIDLFKNDGINLYNYDDCGTMIFDLKNQEVFQGGSGCGCSATVYYGYILEQMKLNKYKRVLLMSTGALLSPMAVQQGENIPCIAHAVSLEVVE